MNHEVPLLDFGSVRLVDWMGSDLSVSRAARVSYDAAWRAGEDENSDARLIRYLWRNRHTTPFEAVTFTFEVRAPIFVIRQWHRHRTQSYNELSARYRELPEVFFLPEPENVGVQATKNKQGREALKSDEANALAERRGVQVSAVDALGRQCFTVYRELLADGWPRELARTVLPLSTYTHQFATLNLLNLLKFFQLRDDPHAQPEIQVYAEAMKGLARQIVPVCIQSFDDHNAEIAAAEVEAAKNKVIVEMARSFKEAHGDAMRYATPHALVERAKVMLALFEALS